MEPITVALIASVITQGLTLVAKGMLEEGVPDLVLEPARQPLQRLVRRFSEKRLEDAAIISAVQAALVSIGAPEDEAAMQSYLLNAGFNRLRDTENAALRREMARGALLMVRPDPALVSDGLLRLLGWPSLRRQLLADFLHALRNNLRDVGEWSQLFESADRDIVRSYLSEISADTGRTAIATERSAAYLRAVLTDRGLDPDKSDVRALEDYIAYVLKAHRYLSFLFVKPAGRKEIRTEAELETVFVPLLVDDPEISEQRLRVMEKTQRDPDLKPDRIESVTINEVLTRYPVFLLKGLPGSGKTTLLRHMAFCLASGGAETRLGWTGEPLLPIMIPLRNFGSFLEKRKEDYSNIGPRALREFIEKYFVDQDLRLPPDFFLDRLREGKCLVLLDGLDEVADRDQRARVAQMVSAFIKTYSEYGNRFGLASRPRGYEEVIEYLPKPVVCAVLPLTPAGRDELVTNLLKVLEPDDHLRRRETPDLLDQIRRKEKVDELSRETPLFCTTLVLVYKYRQASLPERRVDVFSELVELLLGLWEVYKAEREGVSDVRELVLADGTGRKFMDEKDAVEAKRRAMTYIADWLQRNQLADVEQMIALEQLERYFHEREGASDTEKKTWAENFLVIAHERSGLFVEAQPGIHAFSHGSFREYLAATALIEDVDDNMLRAVLEHADDSWWEEVILLAAAHPGLGTPRRELLLQKMLEAGHTVLAGRCAVDAGARLPAPMRQRIMGLLHERMTEAELDPKERYAAGEVLDELGWLPDDLNVWLPCPKCADGGGDLAALRYPVTNVQFERFILAGGYDEPAYWGGKETAGWNWRESPPSYRGEGPVIEPEYWHGPRFGRERRGYPVVGVSWYEATAYATWLTGVLRRARAGDAGLAAEDLALVVDLLERGGAEIRLSTEDEWRRMAGGTEAKDRYPWDPPKGPATKDKKEIVARCNVSESRIGRTSPVGMYPLGESRPHHLRDLGGNVWEWTQTEEGGVRVLVGGSWAYFTVDARCASRLRNTPRASRTTTSGCGSSPPLFLVPDSWVSDF